MSNTRLKGVADTLFIPLMARKYVSEVFPEYFYDEKVLEIVSKLPPNQILENSSEYTLVASASRCVIMDDLTVNFIKSHKNSNIVCIGCGLETMAWRLSKYKDKTQFYEVDFERVINQRKEILGKLEHETLISGDINILDLTTYMDCSSPTLFVVAGVFEYFKEAEVLALIKKLQGEFQNAEMIFDTVSSAGLKFVNRYVKKTGNLDAMMYFAINNGEDFAKLSGTKLIKAPSMYCTIEKDLKKKLKLYTKISMSINDKFNMSKIYHILL